MQKSSLTSKDIQILQSSDRSQLLSHLRGLPIRHMAEWLGSSNSFKGAATQLRKLTSSPTTSDVTHFLEYLVSSAFVHCGDAWSYLGRAIDALLRGDIHIAIHLIYYAELRATVALLASDGIFVGDHLYLVINSSGVDKLHSKDNTHRVVWYVLDAWADSPNSMTLLEKILRPENTLISDWGQNLGGSIIPSAAKVILASIATDLNNFWEDRSRRNISSYQPSRIEIQDLDAHRTCQLISDLWVSLEPSTKGSFPNIDRMLLRTILIQAYSSTHLEVSGNTDWDDWPTWLKSVSPSHLVNGAFYLALLNEPSNPQTFGILNRLNLDDRLNSDPTQFISSMLARTILLLRVSTGSCIELLNEAGLNSSHIDYWIKPLCVSRGIWSMTSPPLDPLDLWMDIDDANDKLKTYTAGDRASVFEYLGDSVIKIGQTERVLAWSF